MVIRLRLCVILSNPPPPPARAPLHSSVQVLFVTSQAMVPRIREICRDPRVIVVGLDDGVVPESDDMQLGRVRRGRVYRSHGAAGGTGRG